LNADFLLGTEARVDRQPTEGCGLRWERFFVSVPPCPPHPADSISAGCKIQHELRGCLRDVIHGSQCWVAVTATAPSKI
jgi:hypothetical protein